MALTNLLVNIAGTAKSTGKHFSVDAYNGPSNDAGEGAADAAKKIKAAMEPTGAFSDINLTIRETAI